MTTLLTSVISLRRRWCTRLAILALVGLAAYAGAGLFTAVYADWKGPHRGLTDVADFDADGDLDVIIAHARWESATTVWAELVLWINQGDGRFVRGDHRLSGGLAVVAGDANGDGASDLFIYDGDKVAISLNQNVRPASSTGLFWTGRTVVGPGPADFGGSLLLGDLNNDGAVDAFVTGCCLGVGAEIASETPPATWTWLNEQNETATTARQTTRLTALAGVPIQAAALGDLDGDGDFDAYIAVAAPTDGTGPRARDLILLNDGAGAFTDSTQALSDAGNEAVGLGDLDNDGDLDVLLGSGHGVEIWINQGGAQGGVEGRLARSTRVPCGQVTRSVFLDDLDGDGDRDALLGGARQALILWNSGTGGWVLSSRPFQYPERHGLALGDFDGDGLLDVFAGAGADSYRLWLNLGGGTFEAR